MKLPRIAGVALALAALLVGAASAQSLVWAYIRNKEPVTLTGTIVEAKMFNPHSAITIKVRDVNEMGKPAPGSETYWAAVLPMASNFRRSFTTEEFAEVFSVGQTITIAGYRPVGNQCSSPSSGPAAGNRQCLFAGRLATLSSGCKIFIGSYSTKPTSDFDLAADDSFLTEQTWPCSDRDREIAKP